MARFVSIEDVLSVVKARHGIVMRAEDFLSQPTTRGFVEVIGEPGEISVTRETDDLGNTILKIA